MDQVKEMDAVLFDAVSLRQEARMCTRLAHIQVEQRRRDALFAIRRDCLRLARYLDEAVSARAPPRAPAGRSVHAA